MKSTHYTGKRRGRGKKDFQGGATAARQSTGLRGGDFAPDHAHLKTCTLSCSFLPWSPAPDKTPKSTCNWCQHKIYIFMNFTLLNFGQTTYFIILIKILKLLNILSITGWIGRLLASIMEELFRFFTQIKKKYHSGQLQVLQWQCRGRSLKLLYK